MMRFVAFGALVLVAALAPSGLSQAQTGPRLFLLHDVPDDGYTYVGNVNHFGYILQDEEGNPTTHQNGVIEVYQNGLLLYKTSEVAGHDYDVLNTFQVVFPMAGPYEVKARVPLSGSVNAEASFSGVAVGDAPNATARIELEPVGDLVDGTPEEFRLRVLDEATGTIIPHSDALVEIRRPGDDWLIFRTHLHSHVEDMSFHFLFPQPGDYLVRAVGYMAFPEPTAPRFAPVSVSRVVTVGAGEFGQGSNGIPEKPAAAAGSGYELQTSIDPQDVNTPFSRTIVSGLVFDDEAGAYVPHVNFEAWVDEPTGHTIFYSNSLHEYDGLYDILLNLPYPSQYTLTLLAMQGDWSAVLVKPFTIAEVVPPLITSAGGVVVTATGLDSAKSAEPAKIEFRASNFAGAAAQHSEIDFQILREEWGAPILQNKVHTHGSGMFEVDVTFPEAGDYLLVVDPVTIHGEPTPEYYFGSVGGELVVPFTVAEGPALPLWPVMPEVAPMEAPAELPGLALVGLVASLGGAVLLRRRA